MKKYPDSFKQRCISGVKKRLKEHKLMKSIRLVADFEGIPAKSVEAWWYAWKKAERAQVEAEAQAGQEKLESLYRSSSEKVESATALLPIEPVVPAAPPPPVIPHVESESGLLRCSRCKSTSHLRQLEDGGYYCDVCQVALPYEPMEDYEMKYRESPYRRNHWMA